MLIYHLLASEFYRHSLSYHTSFTQTTPAHRDAFNNAFHFWNIGYYLRFVGSDQRFHNCFDFSSSDIVSLYVNCCVFPRFNEFLSSFFGYNINSCRVIGYFSFVELQWREDFFSIQNSKSFSCGICNCFCHPSCIIDA